jgi:primosomal protein N' (replication factor Y)
MIAKGHDFPAVTLVGVVSADVGLGLADFRAAERTFQLLTQVVGRAGRGDTPGEAVIQTLSPDHYSVRAAAAQDYAAFFEREIEFRRAMQYPPTLALVNVVVKGPTLEGALTDAQDLVAHVRRTRLPARVLGPAPAALSRIKDEYRVQFFLKGTRRRALRDAVLAALEARPDLRRRAIVDVDPVSTS